MIMYVTHQIYTYMQLLTGFVTLSGTSYCDADMLGVGTDTVNHNYYFKVHEGIAPMQHVLAYIKCCNMVCKIIFL
jgi:hypothetical protein